jgi:hypothetical protein
MDLKTKTVLLLAACAAGCQSIDLPDGGEVRVVDEVRPSRNGAYVLVYRTELAGDCAARDAEIEKVWAAVRSRAEESEASSANVISEASDGGSVIGFYRKPSEQWRRIRFDDDGPCPAPSPAGPALPEIEGVPVVSEIRPRDHGAYVLVYRSSLAPTACEALKAEIEKAWAVARSRAEESKASLAEVIAEGPGGASTVATFTRPSGRWQRLPSRDGRCPAP